MSKRQDLLLQMLQFERVIEDPSERPLYQDLAVEIKRFLSWRGSATLSEIIRFLGGSSRRVLRLLDQMVQQEIISYRNGLFLSNANILSNHRRKGQYALSSVCPGAGAFLSLDEGIWEAVSIHMKEIWRGRPAPTFLFDQRPVTLRSSMCRVAYACARGDFAPPWTNVAVIGDDDLSSIIWAFFAKEMEIQGYEIAVFEIDRRLISFIEKTSRRYDLNIHVNQIDIYTEPFPPLGFENRFDVIIADPTPTPAPLGLFLNFGLRLLRNKPSKVIYLSAYSPSSEAKIETQRILTQHGLLITEMLPAFVEYAVVEETLSQRDKVLFDTYKQKKEVDFVEAFIRLETTTATQIVEQKYDQDKVLGKATKRVLKNIKGDPAYLREPHERGYLSAIARSLRKNTL